METVTSFSASAVRKEDLSKIVGDYLALDRVRVMRRLLVVRCGLLALAAAVGGFLLHGFSMFARSFSVVMFLIPPLWAWVVEIRLDMRLSQRLDGAKGKRRLHVPDVSSSTDPAVRKL